MASSIPGATQALISIATAALPSTAQIWFGKALPVYTAPLTLQILKMSADQEWAFLGPTYKREEIYAIHCELTSWAGDQDYISRLNEVMNAFQTLTLAIYNNPTLNNTVRLCEVKRLDYEPDADAKGMSLGRLDFTVDCQQRISTLT